MNEFSVSVSSITYAIKAQNALRNAGIRSTIVRDERYLEGKGCGYAVLINGRVDRMAVMNIMQREHIKLTNAIG